MENLTAITNRLDSIKEKLKSEFIGLDHIIDQLIQAVTPWCTMASSQRRPLIVNLWGMTGVGKTSLITRFMELWDNDEDVIHFNMGSKNFMNDMLNAMERMYTLDGKPAVLIFDEFQHAKTIDGIGRELENPVDRMIWQLMDDGRFSFVGNKRFHPDIKTIVVGLELCMERGVVVENGKVTEGWGTLCEIMDVDDHFRRNSEGNIDKFVLTKDQFSELYDCVKREFPFRVHLKDFLLQMNGTEILAYLKKVERKALLSQNLDFSKFLVIVIGNLDEAYEMSGIISADNDPDLMYEESKKISFSKIKNALSYRFRLEEIARLGNVHLIYPSLSSAVYRSFIDRELDEIGIRFREVFACNLSFSKKVKATLFEEGVVASQGFRPLRSSIRYLIESNLFELLQCIPSQYESEVLVDMEGDDLTIIGEGQVMNQKRLHLPIREAKRRKQNPEYSAITAVHEAGHALVYILLRHRLPKILSIASSDQNKGGYMGVNSVQFFSNKDIFIRELAVRLAGKKAEELVFGVENITEGGELDVKIATKIALNAFRDGCLNEKTVAFESKSKGSGRLLPDPMETDQWVVRQLGKGYGLAGEMLESHLEAFQAIVGLLLEKRTLDADSLALGLDEKGIDYKQLLEVFPRAFSYSHQMQEFFDKSLQKQEIN